MWRNDVASVPANRRKSKTPPVDDNALEILESASEDDEPGPSVSSKGHRTTSPKDTTPRSSFRPARRDEESEDEDEDTIQPMQRKRKLSLRRSIFTGKIDDRFHCIIQVYIMY